MSAATNTTGWLQATEAPAVSRGKNRIVITGDVTLSDDYEEGGDGLSFPSQYGVLRALYCSPQVAGGYILSWNGDPDDPAIMVHEVVSEEVPDGEGTAVVSALAEVADETDNSGISVTVVATFES
jgi:hypothetical protein